MPDQFGNALQNQPSPWDSLVYAARSLSNALAPNITSVLSGREPPPIPNVPEYGKVPQVGDPRYTNALVEAADIGTNFLPVGGGAKLAGAAVPFIGGIGRALARDVTEAAPKLAMDEASRLARAKELGFNIDAYKGAYPYDYRTVPDRDWKGNIIPGTENRVPQELTEFDARKSSVASPDDLAGFFSSDPAVASRFASAFGEGSVFPVKLKMQNPKIIDAEGRFAADFQFGPGGNRLKLPEDSPHDGIILKNTKDEGDVYIPREPHQIRSRFAAFDPRKKESGNLLAGLAGASVLPPAVFDDNTIDAIRKYGIAGIAALPPAIQAQVNQRFTPVDHQPEF